MGGEGSGRTRTKMTSRPSTHNRLCPVSRKERGHPDWENILLKADAKGTVVIAAGRIQPDNADASFSCPDSNGKELGTLLAAVRPGDQVMLVFRRPRVCAKCGRRL
jgi:hypothetical protein